MKRPAFQTVVEDMPNLKALPHDTVLLDTYHEWYQIMNTGLTHCAYRFGTEFENDLWAIGLPAIVVWMPTPSQKS